MDDRTNSRCQSCGNDDLQVFYEVRSVPVHSVLLMPTSTLATNYRRGDIALAVCSACGFIGNMAFDPDAIAYSQQYEETQGFSPTYTAFARRLAEHLVARYDLHGRDIIEIGCGKGEFLYLLCELGQNRGTGFDPSYVEGRLNGPARHLVTFINDFYSEEYASYRADFICCRMTLEHIQNAGAFVRTVRNSVGDRMDTTVFFQVPNVTRILRDLAFWDIYYEHCSYFSAGSLASLFSRCDFEVVDVWLDYDEQYLMLEALPCRRSNHGTTRFGGQTGLEETMRDVALFSRNCRTAIESWKARLADLRRRGRRTVLWGSGSKGVAFLTTLSVQDEVTCAVDINPHRSGTFMAGTGHPIVEPVFLKELRPDCVIVMNPIYREEIRRTLESIGVAAEILSV